MIFMIYGVACIFYLLTDQLINGQTPETFISYNELLQSADIENLITMMYFSLTILSTVGYGDYFPISPSEMLLTVIIMLMGVAVFSWIMGEFNVLLANGNSQDNSMKQQDLNIWLL
jgi:voltage-gated potassium channel Kch